MGTSPAPGSGADSLMSWCDVEFDGRSGGSRHHRQGFGEFEPSKVGAQAVMHAGTEGLHWVGAISSDGDDQSAGILTPASSTSLRAMRRVPQAITGRGRASRLYGCV